MKCLLPASGFFRNKLKIGKFRQKLTDFGRSVIIGSQETQIYQRFAGSRQEGFILKIALCKILRLFAAS